jgi:hypothetical protein
MSNPATTLIELRRHYESVVAQAEFQLAEATAQLKHIDALLLNGVLQGQELPALKTLNISPELPTLALDTATTPASAPEAVAPTSSDPAPALAAIAPPPESSQGERTPRPLLPAYEGLKRFDAIAKALQTTAGREMSIERLIGELFGNLSAADQKSETKRLYTLMYNGVKRGLWKKGKAPSSYLVGKSKIAEISQPTTDALEPKASATKNSGGGSLALLSEFEGMNKLEVIAKVLTEHSGHALHQDSIIQMLYGDLSPEVIKGETRKLRSSLFQGVSKGLWQKASNQPSSYLVKGANARKSKTDVDSEIPDLAKATPVTTPKRKPSAVKA